MWVNSWVAKFLKFSGEGLVQERLLQRRQRGQLPLVEAGEASVTDNLRSRAASLYLMISWTTRAGWPSVRVSS